MPLQPTATNSVTCSVCGWTRVLDPTREYRSGHTHPTTMQECHEMLVYTQLSPLPIEVYLLGEERPKTPMPDILSWRAWEVDPNALVPITQEDVDEKHDLADAEEARNLALNEQIADIFEMTTIPEPPPS